MIYSDKYNKMIIMVKTELTFYSIQTNGPPNLPLCFHRHFSKRWIGGPVLKRCQSCEQIKSYSEFYKNKTEKDGFQRRCKECCKIYERTTQYRIVRNRYRKTLKGQVANKRYNTSEKAKNRRHEYYERYPERNRARGTVFNAIMAKKLLPPTVLKCSCGFQAQQYHHYKGYNKKNWLEVTPLCIKCHIKEHAEITGSPTF